MTANKSFSYKLLSLVRVVSTRVSSSNASRWTVRRRSGEMSSVREVISGGGAAAQLQDELTVLTDDERQELVVPVTQIPLGETLAMKADLVLPWKKRRTMRR